MAASGMKSIEGGTKVGEKDGEPNVARAVEAQALDRVGAKTLARER